MRTFSLIALLFAACGSSGGPADLIPCGPNGATCDVGSGAACCISTSSATCTKSACSGPTFTCVSAADCGNKLCCVNQLGSSCAATCDSQSNQACLTNADCANLAAQTCTGGTKFTDQSGHALFSISFCVF